MTKTEIKIVNIENKDIHFHISYELKNFKDLICYVKVKNEQEFRKFENSNKIIKRVLSNYLFEELGKYFVLKASLIDESDEFNGVFEVFETVKIPQELIREVTLKLSEEKVNVELKVQKDFEECEFYERTPFNISDSISAINPIFEVYDDVVLIGKIREENDRIKVSNSYNSGEGTIYKCFEEFLTEKFGTSFIFKNISQRSCSHFEVQIKYKIIPNIVE